MDVVYVVAGLAVPTATCIGLWLWAVRTRSSALPAGAADEDDSELARSVAAVADRLAELSDQLEVMSRHWEERDSRLTGQLNALIKLTEQLGRVDPWIGEKPGERR
jgi:hypothetical protein